MGFPTPQFGVPLSPSQVNPELPFNIVYGVTPSNKYIPISIDSMGKLNVNATLTGTVTIGEIGAPDESSFAFGASLQQTIGGVYQDTNPTLSAGEQGAVRLTQYRAFHTNLRDSSGNEVFPATEATSLSILADLDKFTFSSTRLVVDGSQVTQPVSATALPLPANAAKETGGNLAAINAGIQTLNSLVPSEYDYISLQYSGNNLTQAKFYLGGPSGTVISTLMLSYVGNNLASVQRS